MDSMPTLESLGQFIRERRSTLNLKQRELAERLGWTQERISVLENGKYGMPSVPALVRLAGALDVPFGDLLAAAGYPDIATSRSAGKEEPASVALGYALQRLLAIDAYSVDEALRAASDLLVQAMGADKIDAFLFMPESDTLVAMGTSDTPMGRRQHELGLEREPVANGGRTVEVYQTGRPFYTPQADEDPAMLPGVVRALGVRSYLAVPLRPDGEIIGVLAAASGEPDHFGEDERQFFEAVARWVAMIARRAQLTEELTRVAAADARRLAAEELVTLLAHDISGALSTIIGRLDLLRRRLVHEGWERGLADLDAASHSVRRLQRMVTDLLEMARIEGGIFAPQAIDLVAVIEELVAELRPTRACITTHLPEELQVQADPDRIRQALHNLLSTAVTHTPDEMPVLVRAGTEQRDDGRWAVVNVHNEGHGIPKTRTENGFARFTSGPNSAGLGVDLYLARQIIEAHGGTLVVQPAPGKGASFKLALPLTTVNGQDPEH